MRDRLPLLGAAGKQPALDQIGAPKRMGRGLTDEPAADTFALQAGRHGMTGWIIVAVLAAIVIYAIVVFNGLVRQRNMVREGWSGIDVQLKRRTDLVPNLVETVRAYAAHERSILEEVAAKR